MHMPDIIRRLLPGNDCEKLLEENVRLSHEINERMNEAAGEVTRLRANGHDIDQTVPELRAAK